MHITDTLRPTHRRLAAAFAALSIVGAGALSLACSGDEPTSPTDSGFGTVAQVDNSSVDGGDTPVQSNEIPAP